MAACPECPEEGLPEWIMSYADMITILMEFFVVMYSMAGKADEAKQEAVFQSLRIWLGGFRGPGPDKSSKRSTTAPEKGPSEPPNTVKTYRARESVSAGGTLYFNADQKNLSAEDEQTLRSAIEVLAGKRHMIEVRAQASRRPLPAGSPYPDHYDLAYHVARITADYLESHGIEKDRILLRVAARPGPGSASNDRRLLTSDCRVDIFLLDEVLPTESPGSAPTTTAAH